jgi:hypothetical protein
MKTAVAPRMTTSSLSTKSSLEIAYPAPATPRVTQPVLDTTLFPGRASRREAAFALGSLVATIRSVFVRTDGSR